MKLYNLIESFSITVEVSTSPQEVFNCIKDVDKWWSKDYEGSCSQLNDEFVIHHPDRHYSKQKLIELIPNKRMVWLVTESKLNWIKKDQKEWTNTKMFFELSEDAGKSFLRFIHEGLVPEKECYETCSKGWGLVIKDWLFNYITSGKSI